MSDTLSLYPAIEAALMCDCIVAKPAQAQALYRQWLAAGYVRAGGPLYPVPAPGRPARPQLVAATDVPRRGLGSVEGRAALLHAIAHIEFNAINLALDAAWRFRAMPDAFVEDWLRVAAEEAQHFLLLQHRLAALGYAYGDFPAHNTLWDMAVQTDHDVLTRMALVPRVMEARGLDAVPPIQRRLAIIGDHDSAAVLATILQEEVGHVRIGNYWFTTLCDARGLEPLATFRSLLGQYHVALLRGEMNRSARLEAGFTEFELSMLEDFSVTRQRTGTRSKHEQAV
ncbi:ferritin-like domain-containing protein [Vogesella sp. XCS3]|uniref:ferritin-like domain-containing protein n=1 Tax=Vogesella sp. XCS3 TaxID=2877939 RepID=UPI001D0A37F2|nr:ferritin-like domain-containing protein [Vogesella sp. XCS3]UDM17506.1 ferritin-like domain-containing protein [Vogesella sp. XCS3]